MNYEDIPLPRYKCHKEVKAFKIKSIEYRQEYADAEFPLAFAALIPDSQDLLPARVEMEWIAKHTPVPGGYFVCYQDGYESYSPAAPFEEGYTRVMEEGA